MNERMCESLSALMDDESNELELERVLSQIGTDEELRKTWQRYALAQHAVHGHELAHSQLDISVRVQNALLNAPMPGYATPPLVNRRFLRPLASLAVAASVTVTVVVGGKQLAQLEGATPYGQNEPAIVASPSRVGLLNSLGATTVQASYGAPSVPMMKPPARAAYQNLAQQRSRLYMQEHAEQAALNSPQGMVPFARVPEIRE